MIIGLLACAAGPNAETLVSELRVMAIVPDAPEAAVGETVPITVHTLDPTGAGAEVWVWTSGSAPVAAPAAARLEARIVVPPDGVVYAFACSECPPVPEQIADPTAFMADQPLIGASLASKRITITELPTEERRTNPILTGPGTVVAGPEEPVPMSFAVEGDLGEGAAVWSYATAGGFTKPSELIRDGVAEVEWIAPIEGQVDLFVVAIDGWGGTAVWHGAATVEP